MRYRTMKKRSKRLTVKEAARCPVAALASERVAKGGELCANIYLRVVQSGENIQERRSRMKCHRCKKRILMTQYAVRVTVVKKVRTGNVFRRAYSWHPVQPHLFYHTQCIRRKNAS